MDKKEQKAYNKAYWRENREDILAARRAKYASNGDYRELMKFKAREYDARMRKERGPRDPKIITRADGKRFFSIGNLCKILEKPADSIRQWHKAGVLPLPTHYDNRGWRLYTAKQLLIIKDAIETWEAALLKRGEVYDYCLKKGWTNG